jgi:hypothetical protein
MQPKTDSKLIAGVLQLNGIIWGIMVLGYVNAVAAQSGDLQRLGGIFLILFTALIGAGTNAVYCLWKVSLDNRYQALWYFLALITLAVVLGCCGADCATLGKSADEHSPDEALLLGGRTRAHQIAAVLSNKKPQYYWGFLLL